MAEQLRTTELSVVKLTSKPPRYLSCKQIISEGINAGRCKPFIQRDHRFHPCHTCPEAISDHKTIERHFNGCENILRPGFDSIETRTARISVEHMNGEITVRSSYY